MLGHVLESDPVAGLAHLICVVALQFAQQQHSEPHGLSVDEVLARQVFECIEEDMLRALDRAWVPAGVGKRCAAPANCFGQCADAGVRDIADFVECPEDGVENRSRLAGPVRVEPPFLFDLPDPLRELPVPTRGVVTEDVADARPIQRSRRGLDHVEVDVHHLGNDPADVSDYAIAAYRTWVTERSVDGK